MSRASDIVRKYLKDTFGLDDSNLNDGDPTLRELGLDELDEVEMIMEIEADTGIEIPDERFEPDGTLAEFIVLVESVMKEQE